jgi:hypothetical protein
MTSNEYYGKLNTRSDDRAATLLSMGFAYTSVADLGIAVFVRPRLGFKTPQTVTAEFVTHAPTRSWTDRLADLAS